MPTIPAGTKFEAIKPSTVVNRRSALINANDETYTIADFASTIGATITFPLTAEYFPKADANGALVDSGLYENSSALYGVYPGGLNLTSNPGVPLFSIDNSTGFLYVGDVFGVLGASWGISIQNAGGVLSFGLSGTPVININKLTGNYQIGGVTTKFGILNGDFLNASLQATTDLVTNVGGVDYIKINIGGLDYKIELIP